MIEKEPPCFWTKKDPEECPCNGGGWVLCPRDTWNPCPVHNTPGQPHPEDEEACDWFFHQEDLAALEAAEDQVR